MAAFVAAIAFAVFPSPWYSPPFPLLLLLGLSSPAFRSPFLLPPALANPNPNPIPNPHPVAEFYLASIPDSIPEPGLASNPDLIPSLPSSPVFHPSLLLLPRALATNPNPISNPNPITELDIDSNPDSIPEPGVALNPDPIPGPCVNSNPNLIPSLSSSVFRPLLPPSAFTNPNPISDPDSIPESGVTSNPNLISSPGVNSNPCVIIISNPSPIPDANPDTIASPDVIADPNLVSDPIPNLIANPDLASAPNPNAILNPYLVSVANPSAISDRGAFPKRKLVSYGAGNQIFNTCASGCGALTGIQFPFRVVHSGCGIPDFDLRCGNSRSELPVWEGLIPKCTVRVKRLSFFPPSRSSTALTLRGTALVSLLPSKGGRAICAGAAGVWLEQQNKRGVSVTLSNHNVFLFLDCIKAPPGSLQNTSACNLSAVPHSSCYETHSNHQAESALKSFAELNCTNFTTAFNNTTTANTMQVDSLLLEWTVPHANVTVTTDCQMCLNASNCATQSSRCGVTCQDRNATATIHCLCTLKDDELPKACSELIKTLPPNISSSQYSDGAGAGSNHRIVALVVGSIVGSVLALLVIGGLLICVQRRRVCNRAGRVLFPEHDSVKQLMQSLAKQVGPQPIKLFAFRELLEATDSFSKSTVLADGGFSTVYECILADGRKAAVKRLHPNGYKKVDQFVNEIRLLSGLDHPSLIRLQGFCYEDGQDPLLVYEFVSNGTLADHLHGCSGRKPLPWGTRLDMALDVSQALAYLHFCASPPIIHRDVKSTNILVDEDFHVKLADFGLSRLVPIESSHIVTEPQGTPGYLDPDYHRCYQLTDKSDVYSFGVVLMELISAKVPVDVSRGRPEINLASLALAKIQSGALEELVDPHLDITLDPLVRQMVTGVAELGFRCLASEKDDRPCMKEVAKELARIKEMVSKTGLGALHPRESESTKSNNPSAKKSALSSSPSAHSVCWSSLESQD